MAELASGAVSSLLDLLRNEALLLSRVGIDVEFIEEMESMHSFLEHLARTAPPVGGHDEQVRTWMRQVRDLAYDCRNCIDLYLQRGDPAVYRARGGRWRYLWWASWLLHRIIAQHRAAIRLRELKERARDVGERRFRYGVEIPGKAAVAGHSGSDPSTQAAALLLAAADEEDDNDDDSVHIQAAAVVADSSDPRRRALEPHALEDYCADKLADWLKIMKQPKTSERPKTKERSAMPSIAIVIPDKRDAQNVVDDTWATVGAHFEHRILVKLHRVHFSFQLLQPFKILYYILRELEHGKTQSQEAIDQAKEGGQGNGDVDDGRGGGGGDDDDEEEEEDEEDEEEDEGEDEDMEMEEDEEDKDKNKEEEENDDENQAYQDEDYRRWQAYQERSKVHYEMMKTIRKMKVDIENMKISNKIEQIKIKIQEMKAEHLSKEAKKFIGTTGVLLMALLQLEARSHEQTYLDYTLNQARSTLEGDKKKIIEKIAAKLKNHMEKESTQNWLWLDHVQYQGILQEALYPTKKSNKEAQDAQEQDKPTSKLTSENIIILGHHQNNQEGTLVTVEKLLDKIERNIAKQLLVKRIVNKIKGNLQGRRALIVLNDSKKNYISRWEEIQNALNLLVDCVAGVVIMTTTKDRERTKKFCYPPGEPITYSLVGRYYDAVLQFIGQRVNSDDDYIPKIILNILGKCDPHEFCMKMFAHVLYSNPNRSTGELHKLCEDLQDSRKSWATNAKKMFKFSYNDLPREHKSCLLYLAIFPQGYNIQRSTIVGRWVTEGLITKEDWHTAARHADRCFDNLINRWLVLPKVIGAAGKVKSCVVGVEVHGCITKIAYKEHILDARLSKQWARHFSIFSGLRLRASSNINKFVRKLLKYSSQLPLLKLLDLEDCHWLNRDRHYLKDICSKILLLKYLSLRGTNITHLPSEINNLHELEVLDIWQTKVPEHETRDVLLLKLRRLLAGHADPSTSRSPDMRGVPIDSLFTSVRIPCKIEKMENMEVLSNVKASRHGDEIKEIRKLWRLRKLGVVIDDKEAHLKNFLRVASDLKERLQSISITITETKGGGTQPIEELLSEKLYKRLIQPPKSLESLSISGTATQKRNLVPLLVKGTNELEKVNLSRTSMEQDDLNDIAELPNLQCVKLRHEAYNTQHKYTFKNNEFQHLKYLLVEGHNMTDITFEDGAAPELEKIVLSSTKIRSLCGVGRLPKLTEFKLKDNELICSSPFDEVGEAIDINTKTRAFTFKKNEFEHLKYFTVEGSNMSEIIFEEGSLPELEKITLSCTDISVLCGVDKLTKLEEIELKHNKKFLSLFEQANQITKVTLYETLLKQSDLHSLATKPKLICLELLEKSCDESELIFDKKQFPKLKILVIKCSNITKVSFTEKSAPILKKLIWSYSKIEYLSGIENLLKLKELEFSGDLVPHKVRKDIETHHNKPFLIHKKLEQQNQAEDSELEDEDDTRCSPISWILKKKQVQP